MNLRTINRVFAIALAIGAAGTQLNAQGTGNFGQVIIQGNGTAEIVMKDRKPNAIEWRIDSAIDGLEITQARTLVPQFFAHNDAPTDALGIAEFGVGVGTFNPQEALHVFSNDAVGSGYDHAKVLIENTKSATEVRTMLEMTNNGGARMTLRNTDSGEAWKVLTNAADQFMVTRDGTGGSEFAIRKNGAVVMGPGGNSNFVLSPNGNLTIKGTVNQQSDRNAKEEFRKVNPSDVLSKLAELPVTTWRYKDDERTVRHIGPTAQDFRRAFGLGSDEKTIAMVDASGVALAAIKALNSENDRQSAQIAVKDKQIESLANEVGQLESQLTNLQSQFEELQVIVERSLK